MLEVRGWLAGTLSRLPGMGRHICAQCFWPIDAEGYPPLDERNQTSGLNRMAHLELVRVRGCGDGAWGGGTSRPR